MNVEAVMAEIGSKLGAIEGLRVFPYNVGKVPPPGAVVGLPEDIAFDQTYGRGSDAITLPVWVLVAKSSDRAANHELAAYLSGSGARSVKAAVDSTDTNAYTSCDTVTVTTAVTGAYTSGGVDMLGAEFTVDIRGRGQVS
jgi:hypothetical protein